MHDNYNASLSYSSSDKHYDTQKRGFYIKDETGRNCWLNTLEEFYLRSIDISYLLIVSSSEGCMSACQIVNYCYSMYIHECTRGCRYLVLNLTVTHQSSITSALNSTCRRQCVSIDSAILYINFT